MSDKYEPPLPEPGSREVVLPSGRYARMRPLTWGIIMNSYDENPFAWMMKLALYSVEIDGVRVVVDQVINLPMSEAMPILSMLSEALKEAYQFRGGIK